ncbi:hypothetical protein TNCV_96291 [Trichonephila clavipes]|nr:hypothetical protein TNCV_96291 [Trichonephila clavipes]
MAGRKEKPRGKQTMLFLIVLSTYGVHKEGAKGPDIRVSVVRKSEKSETLQRKTKVYNCTEKKEVIIFRNKEYKKGNGHLRTLLNEVEIDQAREEPGDIMDISLDD